MVRNQNKSTVSFPLRTALAALSVSTVLLGAMTAQAQEQTAANPPQAPQPVITGKLAPLGLAAGATTAGPASIADLAQGLLDSVVNISTSQTVKDENGEEKAEPAPQLPEGSPFQEFFDDFFSEENQKDGGSAARKMQSLGSGFVIDAEKGLVVTNNHVIADADEIEVNFTDGKKLKAELLGTDTKTDIALLKVDPTKHKLTAVGFGDSEKSRIGDWVMAIGNPFGLGGTVTLGIISARNRDIQAGPYDNFIQTDAAINRGNSGGPLFDMNGKVIGINTAIISPTGGSIGIGFAIPSELAVSVIQQLEEFGETRRGWLGVRIQPVTDDVAESFGMSEPKGALVAGLIANSGVENKELMPGDIILKFDGKDVESARDLPRVVAESPVGKEVSVLVLRKGKEQTVKIKLGRLEDYENKDKAAAAKDSTKAKEAETVKVLGMTLGKLDDAQRKQYEISADVEGVVISAVEGKSAAEEKRVNAGDVIVEFAQEAVKAPADIQKKIEKLRQQGRKNALLMLAAPSGELRFVTLRID
ncbi:DegQ family serine endoprotease [Ochrobactrum sp. SFR4]|uniref:DegQ family serine endoprotease n=1 Tax=Ochrobactrum sp. SFR4 TaxID=2717368 RepID=UPI0025701064|nr:DegQ family serine endoprotease [Ochrobactrum sp. SFR4]